MEIVKERRGSRRKLWRIRISPIPPDRYPGFRDDPEHAFASMAPEKRLGDIDVYCARLWAARDAVAQFPAVMAEEAKKAA